MANGWSICREEFTTEKADKQTLAELSTQEPRQANQAKAGRVGSIYYHHCTEAKPDFAHTYNYSDEIKIVGGGIFFSPVYWNPVYNLYLRWHVAGLALETDSPRAKLHIGLL